MQSNFKQIRQQSKQLNQRNETQESNLNLELDQLSTSIKSILSKKPIDERKKNKAYVYNLSINFS